MRYGKTADLNSTTIGDKIIDTMYSTRVTLENKTIHTPSPPFIVEVFVVYYRVAKSVAQHCMEGRRKGKLIISF